MGRFDQFLRQRLVGTGRPTVVAPVAPRPVGVQTPVTPTGNPMATSALPIPIPTNQMGAQQYVQGRDAYRDRVNLPALPSPDYEALRQPEGVRFAAAIRAQQAREASISRVTSLIPGTDVARLNALPDDKLAEAEQTAVQLAAPSTVGQDRPTVVPPVAPVIAAPASPPPPGSGYDQASWDALPPETQDFLAREDAKRQLAPDTTPITAPITAINQASAGSTVTPSPKDLAVQEIQSLDAAIAAAQSRGDTAEIERLRTRRTERTDTLALGGAVTQGPSVSDALDPIMKGTRAATNAVGDTLQATTDALDANVPKAVDAIREDPVGSAVTAVQAVNWQNTQKVVGAVLREVAPALNVLDAGRVWSVTEHAEGARQIAYGEDLDLGQGVMYEVLMRNPAFRALGLALEDLSIVDWVKAGGEDRKFNTRYIYENGYTAKNGETFTGDRAVWEWFVGQQNTATRVAIDLLYDPLNVLPVGRAVGAATDAPKVVQAGGRALGLVDDAINLPFKPVEKAVGAVLSRDTVRRVPVVGEWLTDLGESAGVQNVKNKVDYLIRQGQKAGDELRAKGTIDTVLRDQRQSMQGNRRIAREEENRVKRDQATAATDEQRDDLVARETELRQSRTQSASRQKRAEDAERAARQARREADAAATAEDKALLGEKATAAEARATRAQNEEMASYARLRAALNPDIGPTPDVGPEVATQRPLTDAPPVAAAPDPSVGTARPQAPSPEAQAEAEAIAFRLRQATQVPPNPDIGPTPLDDAPPATVADEFEAPPKDPGETTPRYTNRVRQARVDHIRATTDEPAWLEDPLPPGTVDSDELERIALDGTPDRMVDGTRVVGTARQARVKLREISTGLADDLSARRTAKYGMDDIRYSTGGVLERGHWTNQAKLSKSMDPVLKVDKGWEDVNPLPGRRPRDVAPEPVIDTPPVAPVVDDVAPAPVVPTARTPAPDGAVRPDTGEQLVRSDTQRTADRWLDPADPDDPNISPERLASPMYADVARDQLGDEAFDAATAELRPIAEGLARRPHTYKQVEDVVSEGIYSVAAQRVYTRHGATIDMPWPRDPQIYSNTSPNRNAWSERRLMSDLIHGTDDEAIKAEQALIDRGFLKRADGEDLLNQAQGIRDYRDGLATPESRRIHREIREAVKPPETRLPTSTKLIADAADTAESASARRRRGGRPRRGATTTSRTGDGAAIADTPSPQAAAPGTGPTVRASGDEQDLLDVYVANNYIKPEDAETLRTTVLVGKTETPIWNLYLTELSKADATAASARAAVVKRLDPALTTDKGFASRLGRGLANMAKWVRESILYSPANVIRRLLQETVSDLAKLTALGETDAAAKVISPQYLHSALRNARTGKHGEFSMIDGVSRWEKTGEFVPGEIVPQMNRSGLPGEGSTTWNEIGGGAAGLLTGGNERAKAVGRAVGGVMSSRIAKDLLQGMDIHKRLAVWDAYLARNMPSQLATFRENIAARATKAGVDPDAMLARLDDLDGWAFSPQDVTRIYKGELPDGVTQRLAQDWKSTLRNMNTESVANVDTKLFSYQYTNADELAGKVFMFHYWQSRAIPQYARTVLQNNRLIAAHVRYWNAAEAEMEAKGYPDSFRGYAGFMASDAGLEGLINLPGWMTPLSMLVDHSYERGDETWVQKLINESGVMPVPLATTLLSVFGVMNETPAIPVSAASRGMALGFVNYMAGRGIDIIPGGRDGYVGDPTGNAVGRGMEILSGILAPLVGNDPYEGYDPRNAQIREMHTILLENFEERDGVPAYIVVDGTTEPNPAFKWDEYAASTIALDAGSMADPMAADAFSEWSDIDMNLGREIMKNTVPASRFRFVPVDDRNQTRAEGREAMDATGEMTPEQKIATEENQLITAGGAEDRNLEIKQGLYQGIGSERQKALSAGHGSITNPKRGWAYEIGGQRYSGEALLAMSYESRAALADQWVAGYNGTEELDTYRAERDAFKEANPDYVPVADHRGNVEDFDDPQYGKGPDAYRTWARTNNPNFADREAAQTRMLEDRGLSGPMLRQELDQWAMGMGGYEAYQGIRQSRSDPDPKPVDTLGGDPDAIPGTQVSGGGGFGGGGGGGDYDPGIEFMMDLEQYTADLAAFERTTGMPVSQMNDPRLKPYLESQGVPELPSAVYRWQEWMATQPPGSDTSPEAYAEYLRKEKDTRAALELERDAQQAAVR